MLASGHAITRDFEERAGMHMATTSKRWTLDELHSLPDDGNKYELVHGDLFVTPPPTDDHETVLARLSRLLEPYVAANHLGYLYHPRAVFRRNGSETEPDLMVRQTRAARSVHERTRDDWDDAPTPILVVEVISPSTRRRDHEHKRAFYMESGVPEYWVVDAARREVRIVRLDQADVVVTTELIWHPSGVAESLLLRVERLFE
jgi:Uma2 family endonuclease